MSPTGFAERPGGNAVLTCTLFASVLAVRASPLSQETVSSPCLASASAERRLPWLLLLFVGSGCAALIYEVAWFQMLGLVIGSSAVSLGVLLGTYMGGMSLGSLLLPRLISPRHHPLRVYAFLELGIGLCGLLLLWILPATPGVYASFVAPGFAGVLARGLLCAALLLAPTVMMGATLPAIARWVEGTPRGMSWLGFFYGGNIAGAVFGCLLAGFYLLRLYDVGVASLAAVGLNTLVGLLGLALAAGSRGSAGEAAAAPVGEKPAGSGAVYLAIALSGFTALGSEVLWTRLLSLLLGGTVYTFSLILAVFLTGLGLGSTFGAWLARRGTGARPALGVCQFLIASGMAWSALQLTRSLPFWPVNASLNPDPWILFQLDLLRCSYAVLPAALLWGASFPLALAAVAEREADAGRLVGRVYAANTLGAIAGAVGTSVLFLNWLGTQHAQQLLIGASVLSGLVLTAPILFPARPKRVSEPAAVLGLAAAAAVGMVLMLTIPKVPWQLVAYGRDAATNLGDSTPIFVGEGLNSSVAVTRWNTGERSFHVSGKVEASTTPQDMRLQRLLGHVSALMHPEPKSVLIVGCGAGVTAGTFTLHPSVKRIVICELEPLVPRVVAEHFGKENYNVVRDPRVEVVFDDARHYMLTTKEKFDVITSDPINPWMKGAATLYTQDYFELVKKRLNPGGVVTQWIPLYEATPDAVRSEMATFFKVFPGGTVWSNDDAGKGYDVVMLGQAEPDFIDIDELQAKLDSAPFARVKESLAEVRLGDADRLLRTYAGRAADLTEWLAGAQINRDSNLRLQYLAGLGANLHEEDAIFQAMLKYRRFPEDLFTGSEARLKPLRAALAPPAAPAAPAEIPEFEEESWLFY